jgi:hypothetical protein
MAKSHMTEMVTALLYRAFYLHLMPQVFLVFVMKPLSFTPSVQSLTGREIYLLLSEDFCGAWLQGAILWFAA